MDAHPWEITIKAYLEMRERLQQATRIARAAEACAESGHQRRRLRLRRPRTADLRGKHLAQWQSAWSSASASHDDGRSEAGCAPVVKVLAARHDTRTSGDAAAVVWNDYVRAVQQMNNHDQYDNVGPSIAGLSRDDVTAQVELAAFDQLGPLTRKVINEVMCVPWSSHKTLELIVAVWHSDPLDPVIDEIMADTLLRANAQILAQIGITDPIAHSCRDLPLR
jgi:hypothetical protein